MTKRLKVLLTILVVVILAAIGGLFYYQKMLKSSADTVSSYSAFSHHQHAGTVFDALKHHHQNNNAIYLVITATIDNAGGTITPDGSLGVVPGKNETYTINPNQNFKIADVKVDGKSVGAVATYTFTNVITDHTISASFAPIVACKPATVVAVGTGPAKTVAAGGKFNIPIKITNNNPVGSACATIFGLVVYPNAGWSTYGYSSNFYVPFKNATYRVINVAPAQSVVTSVTLNAPKTTATGTKITLKVDDYPAGKLISTYSTTVNVVSKYTITQDFGFSGNLPSGTQVGNISPKGTISVVPGASQTFKFSAVSGYKIIGVMVDGKSVGIVNTYTFSNVNADHLMTINFAKAN